MNSFSVLTTFSHFQNTNYVMNAFDNSDEESPVRLLYNAIQHGKVTTVRDLLDGQSSLPNALLGISGSHTALGLSASMGYKAICIMLLSRGAIIDAMDRDGKTPLMNALIEGHWGVARMLLEKGASVNSSVTTSTVYGSALYLAICGGKTDLVQTLLHGGCDINAGVVDPRVKTEKNAPAPVNKPLLYMAVRYGHLHIAQVIIFASLKYIYM